MKLFQSIFGGGEKVGSYPESLIEMATERAVDGTDSRLRLLPGFRKRLRMPIVKAIDHVVALVDGFPAIMPAGRNDHGAEPRLAAVFASAEAMLVYLAGIRRWLPSCLARMPLVAHASRRCCWRSAAKRSSRPRSPRSPT